VEFQRVREMGVTVVEVPELLARVAYVEDQGVAMIRAEQTVTARVWCAAWLMRTVDPAQVAALRLASSIAS
jgi:hypothetical protein